MPVGHAGLPCETQVCHFGRETSSGCTTTKSGVPITEEDADEVAREAEAGYDLKTGKRVGRRSLGGRTGRSPRINFRSTPEVHGRALERAEREGKTLSELAQEALEAYVTK